MFRFGESAIRRRDRGGARCGSWPEVVAGYRHLSLAAQWASDAAESLAVIVPIADARTFEQNMLSVGFDAETFPIRLEAELAVHERVVEGRARLREMVRAIDLLEAQLKS